MIISKKIHICFLFVLGFVGVMPIVCDQADVKSFEQTEKETRLDLLGREQKPQDEEAFLNFLENIEHESIPLRFSDIPFLNSINMPEDLRQFFNSIIMYLPEVQITDKGFSVRGEVEIYGKSVWARLIIAKSKVGKVKYSIVLEMPKAWKFSDTFKKTEHFDPKVLELLYFERAWLALASANYTDPELNRQVKEGLNLFGDIKPSGQLFEKLDLFAQGRLSQAGSLALHGVIGLNRQLVGSMLWIELPTILKFTNWLETTPLKMIFSVEELLTQTATVAVALQGGLKVLLPFQSEWTTLALTGKYIAPKNFEFYGEKKGWIRDFPIKGLHWGNLTFGIISDIALLIESEGSVGVVSGVIVEGELGVGDSVLHIKSKGAISGDTALGDLTYVVQGSAYLKDLFFWTESLGDIMKLAQRVHFIKEDYVTKVTKFNKLFIDNLPSLKLENLKFAFVPRETFEEKKRIEVKVGNVDVFGLQGKGEFFLSENGVFGSLYLPEIVIGNPSNPLFYVGSTGKSDHQGIVFIAQVDLFEQSITSDIVFKTSLFGGIERIGRASFSKTGIEILSTFKLADLFDAQLSIEARLSSEVRPENISAHIVLNNEGQGKLASALTQAAQKLLEDISVEIDANRDRSIEKLEGKVSKKKRLLDKKIQELERIIENKKEACRVAHPNNNSAYYTCKIFKGIVSDQVKLVTLQADRDITLQLELKAGTALVTSFSKISQAVVVPLGYMANFIGNLVEKGIHISAFEADQRLSLKEDAGHIRLTRFEATLFGEKIEIKDFELNINDLKALVIKIVEVVREIKDQQNKMKNENLNNI